MFFTDFLTAISHMYVLPKNNVKNAEVMALHEGN